MSISGRIIDMLKVEGLNIGYGDVQVVWDVNFAVNEGETVAIIGANGAGKTTTLKTWPDCSGRSAAPSFRRSGATRQGYPEHQRGWLGPGARRDVRFFRR